MAKSKKSEKKEDILKESFVEKELLNASVVQRELMGTIKMLSEHLDALNKTLILIREHEFIEFHRSRWKIFAHQLFLGILFAIGTVIGLAIFSWTTYTFFKDSEILRSIVDKQLNSRNFNLTEIRTKAVQDANLKTETLSEPKTADPLPSKETTNTGSMPKK